MAPTIDINDESIREDLFPNLLSWDTLYHVSRHFCGCESGVVHQSRMINTNDMSNHVVRFLKKAKNSSEKLDRQAFWMALSLR